MTNKTIKIKDVAIVAGVSTATVSRALSKPEQVSEATRSAVLDAVRQTGYRINQTARNLRKQRSGVIAALIPDLGNPFFSQILSGMASELSKEGLSLIVVDSQQIGFEPAQMLEFLYMKQADGLIVLDGRIIVPHATAG
ncbi:LacI family DNA-binding transcriptional regulator, partial [Pseudovibrio axinellae]